MNFLLYVLRVLCLACLCVLFYKGCIEEKEGFENTNTGKRHIVLMGDSILKNDAYVKHGETVSDWVRNKSGADCECNTVAMDSAMIEDVYSQMEFIDLDWNTKDTFLFLSVGGNDLLSKHQSQSQSQGQQVLDVDAVFDSYAKLVSTILEEWNNTQLVLLNLYCPISKPHLCAIVKKWNELQLQYANSKNIKVIYIDSSEPNIRGIEPTSEGGEKIAEQIVTLCNF